MAEPLLSVVIPAYNESRRLPQTLRKMSGYLNQEKINYEILVVDDGSTDDTPAQVEQLLAGIPGLRLLKLPINRGKGYAVKSGMLHATGQYILMSDADLSTPIEEFERFLPLLRNGSAVVIGTRKHKEARVTKHQPLWRESMGKVFTWISNVVLGLHVSDFTCGFKAFERNAAIKVFSKQRIERWAFDSEVLFLTRRLRLPMAEVPVQWADSPETKVRIVRDTIVSFLSLFQIRWNALTGKYT